MRNIELKARLHNWTRAVDACERLGAVLYANLHQTDTYFKVETGRLKLREATPGDTELIYYERPDQVGPKGCDYLRQPVDREVKPLLSRALGIAAIVEKARTVYLWENVRIHLDDVRDLGHFIEFEAVLEPEEDDTEGVRKLHFLIETFEIEDDAQQTHSYRELVELRPGV